jgi:DNA-binding NarL/FixJ family response regulator
MHETQPRAGVEWAAQGGPSAPPQVAFAEDALVIRVLLADDHNLVRAGIRALLATIEGVEVVAESADGREALDRIGELRPDVALVDIGMPGLSGLELAGRVGRVSPRTAVVILSMHSNESYVAQALRAGVKGYLLKDAATDELPVLLRAVARGETYLSPAISRQVVDGFLSRSGSEGTDPDPLTPRQREVLQLVAEGKSTKEIAQALDLSVKTVETHRAQIMERLGIHDVAGLVRYAIRIGLVSSDS